MRVGRALLLVTVLLTASACFRQVVNTGRAPSATTVSKPWTGTYVFGLIPAQAIDVTQQCPGGIATVTTQMTVPNWFASAITFGLYTPRNVSITCAQGTAMRSVPSFDVAADAPDTAREAALLQAIELSEKLSAPVVVRF